MSKRFTIYIHRAYRATIRNPSQVAEPLNRHGWSASKLWNVANYYSREVWDETGEIPDDSDLKSELKTHNNYKGLHSQSSQRVLEELAEAFNSWKQKRKNDSRANPPGYPKNNYYDNYVNSLAATVDAPAVLVIHIRREHPRFQSGDESVHGSQTPKPAFLAAILRIRDCRCNRPSS